MFTSYVEIKAGIISVTSDKLAGQFCHIHSNLRNRKRSRLPKFFAISKFFKVFFSMANSVFYDCGKYLLLFINVVFVVSSITFQTICLFSPSFTCHLLQLLSIAFIWIGALIYRRIDELAQVLRKCSTEKKIFSNGIIDKLQILIL